MIGVRNMLMRTPSIMIHLLSDSGLLTRLASCDVQRATCNVQLERRLDAHTNTFTIFHLFLHSSTSATKPEEEEAEAEAEAEEYKRQRQPTSQLDKLINHTFLYLSYIFVYTLVMYTIVALSIHSLAVCCFARNCNNT